MLMVRVHHYRPERRTVDLTGAWTRLTEIIFIEPQNPGRLRWDTDSKLTSNKIGARACPGTKTNRLIYRLGYDMMPNCTLAEVNKDLSGIPLVAPVTSLSLS